MINALIGTQIAIASSRPETTRKAIRGILTTDNAQIVLVDTPGIHRPRTLLGQRLNDVVDESLADVDAGLIGQVPLYLRNAPTALMKSWGNHDGYRYAHDWPGAVAPQEYLPEELRGREYYHPNDRGYEHEVSQRLDKVRSILHSETAPDGYTESKEQNG